MTASDRKICFYVMTTDSGFAPNPFHGVCTLAACTPNHCRARLRDGDLIVGCFRSGQPVRMVYVMEVAEILGLDDYRHDIRFVSKKPAADRGRKYQAGDNIYCKDERGWHRDGNAKYHPEGSEDWGKDLRGNRVFIGRRFVYLGGDAEELPADYIRHLPPTQGIKYLREGCDPKLFAQFRGWAFDRPRLGRLGMPRDMEQQPACSSRRECCRG